MNKLYIESNYSDSHDAFWGIVYNDNGETVYETPYVKTQAEAFELAKQWRKDFAESISKTVVIQ